MPHAFMRGMAMSAIAFFSLASFSSAQASVITATRGASSGYEIIGGNTGSLVFSQSGGFLQALSLYGATLSASGGTSLTVEPSYLDNPSYYSGVSGLRLQSMRFDSSSGALIDEQYSGGYTITLPQHTGISAQDSAMTISDLRVDFGSKTIYASVASNHLASPLQNVPMWQFDEVQGRTNALNAMVIRIDDGFEIIHFPTTPINADHVDFFLPSMQLTAQGLDAWTTGLSLIEVGRNTLEYGVAVDMDHFSSVPEAGTWAMMSLGLAGLAAVSRRRATRAAAR